MEGHPAPRPPGLGLAQQDQGLAHCTGCSCGPAGPLWRRVRVWGVEKSLPSFALPAQPQGTGCPTWALGLATWSQGLLGTMVH